MTSPLVTLHGAGLERDGRWLVRGVNLTVDQGEIVTLIGPNGSGKSTTAKMALGLLTPSEGKTEKAKGTKIGYVPQKLLTDWSLPLSVNRFMTLTGRIDHNSVQAALEQTDVAHLIKANIHDLSGGELQRVMLARAIARKPDLLVLDEPVQGVDFTGEIALYDLIGRLRDDLGCGILMISHDLHIVMASTDKVICLNGHVCCEGSPKSVAESDAYKRLFGPKAAASLAIYEHDHDHTHLADGTVRHADGSITDHCHPDDGHHHEHEHEHDHKSGGHHAG